MFVSVCYVLHGLAAVDFPSQFVHAGICTLFGRLLGVGMRHLLLDMGLPTLARLLPLSSR
jgi:hypothetical protein